MAKLSVSLTESELKALGTPGKFVFDGEHVRDVSSWKDAFLALFEKLDAIAPDKIDALPDNPVFAKYAVRVVAHRQYPNYYTAKFGTNKNVRLKEVSGAQYFFNDNYWVRKLMDFVGVDAPRVKLAPASK